MIGNQGHAWNVPSAPGLFGGHPGASNHVCLIENSDVADRLAAGQIPHWDSLAGTRKSSSELPRAVPLRAGDVLVSLPFGPAGWGDPLERTPTELRRDLADGAVSAEGCQAAYGAVVGAAGVDEVATADRRGEILAARLNWPPAGAAGAHDLPDPGPLARESPLGDQLELAADRSGRRWIRCACGVVLAPAGQNWRESALVSTARPADAGLPRVRLSDAMEFRRYCCPGCGRLHAAEVRPVGAPHLHDLRIREQE